MKLYHCFRQGGESLCEVQSSQPSYLLAPRLDIAPQSPQGFAWIDSGPGASQLSLALLADHFAGANKPSRISDALALCLHHSFKARVVANRPPHGFELTAFAVRTEVSLLAEAHNEPLMLTIAEVLQREFSREQKCVGLPSFEVIRARYLAVLLHGIGCSPGFAGRLLAAANIRDIYDDFSRNS